MGCENQSSHRFLSETQGRGGCIYDLSHFEWGYVVLQNGVLTARETSSCPVWTSHNLAVVSILPVATTELCGLKLRQTCNKK